MYLEESLTSVGVPAITPSEVEKVKPAGRVGLILQDRTLREKLSGSIEVYVPHGIKTLE